MTLAALATYCIALAIAVAIPGPGVMALIGTALGGGLKRAMPMIVGIALGDATWLTMAVLGLAAISEIYADAFTVIRYLGVAYLLYLAYKFWTNSSELKAEEGASKRSSFASLLNGYLITMGNPKPMLFYLALVPVILDLSAFGPREFAVVIPSTFCVLLIVLTPYALLASGAREWLKSSHVYKIMNRTAAALIGTAAIVIGLRAH
ncbi:LysE family translocator [Maritalea sp.]|uniref:LysE family translocator n=1 Tax=Maritalea sp. TaxID=2003361 RepID=UPI003EF878F3